MQIHKKFSNGTRADVSYRFWVIEFINRFPLSRLVF